MTTLSYCMRYCPLYESQSKLHHAQQLANTIMHTRSGHLQRAHWGAVHPFAPRTAQFTGGASDHRRAAFSQLPIAEAAVDNNRSGRQQATDEASEASGGSKQQMKLHQKLRAAGGGIEHNIDEHGQPPLLHHKHTKKQLVFGSSTQRNTSLLESESVACES
jgi:hypothetical protein